MYGMCWSGLYVYMHTWSQSVLTLRWRILKSAQHMETELIQGTDVTDRSEISASGWRSILSEKITLPQSTTSCCLRVATHKHIDPCFQNGYCRKIAPSSALHGYYVIVYLSLKALCPINENLVIFTRPHVVPNLRTDKNIFKISCFVFCRRKKVIQVWNNTRVSK